MPILQDEMGALVKVEIPKHHIPSLGMDGMTPSLCWCMKWGFEYLTYLTYVIRKIEEIQPRSVIDVGCGDGRLLSELAVETRVGIDIDESATKLARCFDPAVIWLSSHGLRSPFDCVVTMEVLEHIPDAQLPAFIKSVIDRIKPGGHWLITVPTTVRKISGKHRRHYTRSLLMEQIQPEQNDLKVIEVRWLYNINSTIHKVQGLLFNNYWMVRWPRLLRQVWKAHLRWSYMADYTNGAHLFVHLKKHD